METYKITVRKYGTNNHGAFCNSDAMYVVAETTTTNKSNIKKLFNEHWKPYAHTKEQDWQTHFEERLFTEKKPVDILGMVNWFTVSIV